jgi:outer membrane protein TolC
MLALSLYFVAMDVISGAKGLIPKTGTPTSPTPRMVGLRISRCRPVIYVASAWVLQMRNRNLLLGISLATALPTLGCQSKSIREPSFHPVGSSIVQTAPIAQLRPSDAVPTSNMPYYVEDFSPMDLNENAMSPENLVPMTLHDCIAMALTNSKLMQDLGVSVIRSPYASGSAFDPAMAYSDPRSGEEAALSAFDANLFASNFHESNDRRYNNLFFGDNGRFDQDLNTTRIGVAKRTAAGTYLAVRDVTVYDRNNQTSNAFIPYSWEKYIETEIRQPLMQGAGNQFNLIAGPGAQPGQLNGILLARVRTDIALVDFEKTIRDFVSEVENAYWDLYYSYRDLDARIEVRDIANKTNAKIQERKAVGTEGLMAQASEQLYRFQADVVDSLNGRTVDGTRTNNGSTGGTFRSAGGVRISERKLRLITGLPINDGKILYPADQPSLAAVHFDWASSIHDAMANREELRRQRWVIKQRELELLANRNFLKPQLDLVSQFRMRGFGDNGRLLLGPDSATSSLFNGQYPEWQMGLEYQSPVGFRRAHAAVRNSQLALAREAEVLREQERAIHFGLSNAMNDTKRAYENLTLHERRLYHIKVQLEEIEKIESGGETSALDVKLETHRRLLDARLRFHQSEVEYALSLRNVHLEKGTLLNYCNVQLNECVSSEAALDEAMQRLQTQDYSNDPKSRAAYIGMPAQRTGG